MTTSRKKKAASKNRQRSVGDRPGSRSSKRETHLVEWKESWRDECLKWLCGFANADGGTLVIGMNDKGEPVGTPDAGRLLVELPNKIRDTLGIVVQVRAVTKKGKDLVEIVVEASPTPISYKGETTSGRAARNGSSRAMRSRRSSFASSAVTGMARRCPTSRSGT